MEFVVLFLLGGALVMMFHNFRKINRLEDGVISLEAELDYVQDVVQTLRKDYSRMVMDSIRRSKPVKAKRKAGRPINPNSVRQKKIRGEK